MRPYADGWEHLRDELARLDCLLGAHVEERWAASGEDDFRGLYISDAEVERLLRPDGPSSDGDAPDRHERGERLAEDIRKRTRRTVGAGTELRLVSLAERFGLGRRHLDVLLVALAPALDRKYARVYAYLRDDVTRTRPTVDLAVSVLSPAEREQLGLRRLFTGRSPLFASGLLSFAGSEEEPFSSRSLHVDERTVAFLLGDDEVAPDLADVANPVQPDVRIDDLPVDAERRATVDRLARSLQAGDGRPMLVYVHGPYGSGTSATVEALSGAAGMSVLNADAGRFSVKDGPDTLRRVLREARLRGAVPFLSNLDGFPEESALDVETVLGILDSVDGPAFVGAREPLSPKRVGSLEHHALVTLSLPQPGYDRRKALWEAEALPDGVDAADLAAKFRLTPGAIADAMSTARGLARTDGAALSRAHVYAGCRAQSNEALADLAQPIEPRRGWDDIILPTDVLAQLREIATHITHQGTVYSEWGFGDRFPQGTGLTALFAGPSGTGKTMAAEIIAAEAGLDLYRIDLSTVVSKYIGETEKNLGRIFDEAADSDAVLLFDEADALFGKRSEVSDAHDRYANIEVNYLLQRVEDHDGAVLLTTNFKGNIDDAFTRRLTASVEFPMPDRAAREAIWRSVFPPETPVGALDLDFLATLELTGGNIKNVALLAAFLAAEDGNGIEMRHVIGAAKREFQKTGRLAAPEDFAEYRNLLPTQP